MWFLNLRPKHDQGVEVVECHKCTRLIIKAHATSRDINGSKVWFCFEHAPKWDKCNQLDPIHAIICGGPMFAYFASMRVDSQGEPIGYIKSPNLMKKPNDPRELAVALLSRSVCSVQVGACLADKHGIFAWGVNHAGFDGMGYHAEREALRRANPRRLQDAILYVAAKRRRNGKIITAKPCLECSRLIHRCKATVYRDGEGAWKALDC